MSTLRSAPDDGLRSLFRQGLPQVMWVSVETGGTQSGIPDSFACHRGTMMWVEYKRTAGWKVGLQPFQVGFHARLAREGGRSFIAVRRRTLAGPRRGDAVDELWLFRGVDAAALAESGLVKGGVRPLGVWLGGPRGWAWDRVLEALLA